MVHISDGDPTSSASAWKEATLATQEAETNNKVEIFPIAVEGASIEKMNQISHKPCAQLSGMKFKELLEIAVQKDPSNPELQYNLGVISSEIDDFDNAKKYYLRAIELKQDYVNAYIYLSALILGQEESILDQMNNLGSSAADDRKYDELKAKRNQLYTDAIPYLESAISIDKSNYQAAKTLSNIYSAVGNTAKYKEYKELADTLEPK